MENAFDVSLDERVRTMDIKSLRRLGALEKDMKYYFGENWRATVKPSTATRKYVAHVKDVAQRNPTLLVAHMYTRYLGDLFGGQMMGSMARRSLGLDPGCGTSFYEFEGIRDTKGFIENWYRELNALELSDEQKQAIVDEGNLVFALNIELFDELCGNPANALWSLIISQLREAIKKFFRPRDV